MNKRQFIKYINSLPDASWKIGYELYTRSRTIYKSLFESNEETGIYERVFACRNTKRYGFQVQEVMLVSEKYGTFYKNCYFIDCGMSYGLHAYGWDGNDCYAYYTTFSYMDKFEEAEFDEARVYRSQYIDMNNIVRLDSSLKYCAFEKNFDIGAIDYFRLYRKYPVCEMLMKMHIYRMFNERALEVISSDKLLQRWIYRNSAQLHDMAFQTAYNAYRKNKEPKKYATSISNKIHIGKLLRYYSDKEAFKKLLEVQSADKLTQYMQEQHIEYGPYIDYISACIFLHLDLSLAKVAFPKNFAKMHDDYTGQQNAELNKKVNAEMKITAEKYTCLEYCDDKYKVVVAKNKKELITEGEKLHHCVGRMGYDQKQASGNTVICFVRKRSSPNTPYVTVEVDCKTLKVLQCYGDHDNVVHKVDDFVKDWIQNAKAVNKKLQRKVA